jgi:hypothetical protein
LKDYPSRTEFALLLLTTCLAIVIHGYHPGVEDAEIYLPGIKQALNPQLYAQNAAFFASHAHLTLFPNLIAASVRLTRLPLDWAVFLWHAFSIFLLLLGAWHLGRVTFRGSTARWGGVALLASLLTLPVAGTALYIMDEYLTTRSFSTPAVLFIIVNVIERKFLRALLWTLFTALIHPLMIGFGLAYASLLFLLDRRQPLSFDDRKTATAAALLLPFGFFPPATDVYREALNSRPYFFLLRWHWYELLGIFAPLLLLWWFRTIGRRKRLALLERMSTALVIFGIAFFLISLVITVPKSFLNLVELQPMRSLHLLYILLFVLIGGLLAEYVLRERVWRWVILFLPLCAGMAYAGIETFPASPHLELPGTSPANDWTEAFLWVRTHTPTDAYFALNPRFMALPGEDQHGFRAIAERSRLADLVKDSGAVTMFPALAGAWQEQVQALRGWEHFHASDFQNLHQRFGVDWIVVQLPAPDGLPCPYQNHSLAVCRVE